MNNETIEPTITLAPSASPNDGFSHPQDMIYLIVCVVIFAFAVFGTMIFDKKQQTEQKIQRIRMIMQSLVIQSVGKDGPRGKTERRKESSSSSNSTSSSSSSRNNGENKEQLLQLDTSSRSSTTAEVDEEEQPCSDDLEDPVVGDVEQGQSIRNNKKKKKNKKLPSSTLERWKQATSNFASNYRNKQSSTATATNLEEQGGSENSSSTMNDDEDEDLCPICIMPFEVGEQVCWSKNPQCDHAFHTKCLKPWLMDHSECPCCRKDYLNWKKDEQQKTNNKNRNHNNNDSHNENEDNNKTSLRDVVDALAI